MSCGNDTLNLKLIFLVVLKVPPPNGRVNKSFSAYIRAQLFHSNADQEWCSKAIKTQDVPGSGADIMWNDRFEWEYEADDLAFLRCVHYV